jgi:hypothetical protein
MLAPSFASGPTSPASRGARLEGLKHSVALHRVGSSRASAVLSIGSRPEWDAAQVPLGPGTSHCRLDPRERGKERMGPGRSGVHGPVW